MNSTDSYSVFALLQAFPRAIPEEAKQVLAYAVVAVFVLSDLLPRLRAGQAWWQARRAGQPQLRYEQDGRCGRVHFESARSRFEMYWEFGGGQTLAVIDVPSPEEWVSRTGLPLNERAAVLQFVATRVIRDQTSTARNRYEIGPSAIRIFDASAA